MLDDGSGNYENTEELDSGDNSNYVNTDESDSSGVELLSDSDSGQSETETQVLTLATFDDLNLGQYASFGMVVAGVGCMTSIGILTLLKMLRV